jgi:hypothetical protein
MRISHVVHGVASNPMNCSDAVTIIVVLVWLGRNDRVCHDAGRLCWGGASEGAFIWVWSNSVVKGTEFLRFGLTIRRI